MKITRTSPLTGVVHVMDVPVTGEQLIRLENGETVQAVLPHLSADQREFVITGITPDEWQQFLGDGDE